MKFFSFNVVWFIWIYCIPCCPSAALLSDLFLRLQSVFPVSDRSSSSSDYFSSNQTDKPLVIVTFINGIHHTYEECKNISAILETVLGAPVFPFYNPTTGSWMKDLSRASVDLIFRSDDIVLARNLTEHFRKIFRDDLHPQGRILHIAHSGGAILTYLAAKHHLSRQEANRIDVITFGGGKSITRKYFSTGRVVNYYARNDPLTIIDMRTNGLLRKYESGLVSLQNTTTTRERKHGTMNEKKHNTTFVFLEAVMNHPLSDHSMFGPTYRMAMDLEADQLKNRMNQLIMKLSKEKSMIRRIRKTSSNFFGSHHFFEFNNILHFVSRFSVKSRNMMRFLRKATGRSTNLPGFFSFKYE
jgi:hypothetical protein